MKNCRFCNNELNQFMTFGKMPIANAFITKDEISDEYFFELAPVYCPSCALFQLIEQPDPRKLFHENYAFFAGTSILMQKHFEDLAKKIIKDYELGPNELTVEIGNNDGGMVEYFKNNGFNHLGVDPSKNVAHAASSKGVNMLNEFFNRETANRIKKESGNAKIFLAANTLAHIPDINSVFEGINELLRDDGIVITPTNSLSTVTLNSFGDHRLFMSLVAAALSTEKICLIDGLEHVNISYPNFLVDLKKIGVKFEVK